MSNLTPGKINLPKSEDQLQAECFQWHWNTYPADRRKLFHVNQKARNAIEGNRMKAMGVVPGVSDLIYLRPKEEGNLYIEMKTETGIQSEDQEAFQALVKSLGYQYIVCRSFEQFQSIFCHLAKHC